MLKKIFIGLLVMSVLSSGVLFFLLKKPALDPKTIHVDTPTSGEGAGDHGEHASGQNEHESSAPGDVASGHGDVGHGESAVATETHAQSEAASPGPAETPGAADKDSDSGHETTLAKAKSESPAADAESNAPASAEKTELPAAETHDTSGKKTARKKDTVPEIAADDPSRTLRLLTDPIGASVFVEGEFLGNTPLDITLQKKPIKISVEAPGYKRFERTLPAENKQGAASKGLFAAVMKVHLEPEKKAKKIAAAPSEAHSNDETEEPIATETSKPRRARNSAQGSRRVSSGDKNYFIQVKSLPDQGANTQAEVERLTTAIREKSSFAIHACRVSLGSKGNWVRILLGPFASSQDASASMNEASALQVDTESPFVTGDQKCL